MRFVFSLLSVLFGLSISACSTTPASALPQPVTIKTERENKTYDSMNNYPMLYAPQQTATPVPICERFVSSMNAAERKIAESASGGYQSYQLYIP